MGFEPTTFCMEGTAARRRKAPAPDKVASVRGLSEGGDAPKCQQPTAEPD